MVSCGRAELWQEGTFDTRRPPAIGLLVHAQVVLDRRAPRDRVRVRVRDRVRVRVRVSPNPDPNQERRAPVCVEHALQPAGHVPHHHQPGQQEERTCSRVGVRLRVGLGLGPGSRV